MLVRHTSATQTCGWAWSPGVLTDPYARRERERERGQNGPSPSTGGRTVPAIGGLDA